MPANDRVRRCVFARFVPGCAAALVSVVGGVGIVAPGEVSGSMIVVALTQLVAMATGFAALLVVAGYRLGPIRRLGARSIVAGLLAPLVAGAVSLLAPAASLPAIGLASIVAGAAAGVVAVPQLLRAPRSVAQVDAERTGAAISCPG